MPEPCVKIGELVEMSTKIEALTTRLDKNDERYAKKHDELTSSIGALGKVYDSIHSLSLSVATIATETKGTKEIVDDIKADVKTLRHLPVETESLKNSVKGLRDDVDKIQLAPVEDAKHYKRAIVVAIIGIIVTAFFAGKFLG